MARGSDAVAHKNANLISRQGENLLWHLHENLIKLTQLSSGKERARRGPKGSSSVAAINLRA